MIVSERRLRGFGTRASPKLSPFTIWIRSAPKYPASARTSIDDPAVPSGRRRRNSTNKCEVRNFRWQKALAVLRSNKDHTTFLTCGGGSEVNDYECRIATQHKGFAARSLSRITRLSQGRLSPCTPVASIWEHAVETRDGPRPSEIRAGEDATLVAQILSSMITSSASVAKFINTLTAFKNSPGDEGNMSQRFYISYAAIVFLRACSSHSD